MYLQIFLELNMSNFKSNYGCIVFILQHFLPAIFPLGLKSLQYVLYIHLFSLINGIIKSGNLKEATCFQSLVFQGPWTNNRIIKTKQNKKTEWYELWSWRNWTKHSSYRSLSWLLSSILNQQLKKWKKSSMSTTSSFLALTG